jgi:hypothetical protein
MKTLLTISLTFLTALVFGQSKANKELTQFFRLNKLDTFLIIKSGCSNCIISYENIDTVKKADTLTISLLFEKKGKQTFMTFSDTGQTKTITNLKTDIFKIIADNRKLLQTKDTYYREQKLAKFQAPCLVTFPYEIIELRYGEFKYRHTLVERDSDDCGTILKHIDWFKVEIEILDKVDKLRM